jgi:hypothetical protein
MLILEKLSEIVINLIKTMQISVNLLVSLNNFITKLVQILQQLEQYCIKILVFQINRFSRIKKRNIKRLQSLYKLDLDSLVIRSLLH